MQFAEANRHTVSAFDAELAEVRGLVCEMTRRALGDLRHALDAIDQRNVALAARVCAGGAEFDALEGRVESCAVRTIALRAPMADDLRCLIAAMKIAAMMRRVGQHVRTIARCVPDLGSVDLERPRLGIVRMGERAEQMLADAAEAYANNDPEAAGAVLDCDAEMDDHYEALTAMLVRDMSARPVRITAGTHLLVVGKQLERIGDHATNIAEAVYFMATGGRLPERKRGGRAAA